MNNSTTFNQPRLQKKGLLALLLLLSMTAPLSTDMYLAAFPTILKQFATTTQMLNYTLVGFFMFFALGMLFIGPISDKFGRKPVLITSLLIYILASILCALALNIEMLIACRVLQAIGAGGMVSVSTAIVKDSFNDAERPKIIALIQTLSVFAPTLAPIIGAVVIKYATWQATFNILAVIGVVSLLLSLLFKETQIKENRLQGNILAPFKSLGAILKNKPFMVFLVATGCTSTIYLAFIAISSYIYIDWFGLSETKFSLFFAFNSLVLMTGPNVYVRIKDKVKPSKIVLISLLTILAGGVLTALLGKYSPFIFALTFVPITFSNSFLRSFATNMLLGQKNMNAGASASVINFSNTALGALGMVVGALSWANYVVGLGVIAIVAMCISLSLIYFFTKKRYQLFGYH